VKFLAAFLSNFLTLDDSAISVQPIDRCCSAESLAAHTTHPNQFYIQGDSRKKVNILEAESNRHCEKVRTNMCLILNVYRERERERDALIYK